MTKNRNDKKIEQIKCLICMQNIANTKGVLECGHFLFCLGCIVKWSQINSKCPLCMSEMSSIQNSKTNQVMKVESKNLLKNDDSETFCEFCECPNNEDKMLLCDGCDCGYHTYCLGIARVPNISFWYCQFCVKNQEIAVQMEQNIEIENARHTIRQIALFRKCRKNRIGENLRRSNRNSKILA